MIVARGPQLVQLVNGYRYRRSVGSSSSRMQSSQVAMSGGKSRSVEATDSLSSIVKPEPAATDRAVVEDHDLLHTSARRSVRSKSSGEGFDRLLRAGDLDLDLAGPIDDRAVESKLGGETPHERPEADALDDAPDLDRSRDTLAIGCALHGTVSSSSTSISSFAMSGRVSAPQLGQAGANSTDPNSASQLGQ